jgi:hypothetical protein
MAKWGDGWRNQSIFGEKPAGGSAGPKRDSGSNGIGKRPKPHARAENSGEGGFFAAGTLKSLRL